MLHRQKSLLLIAFFLITTPLCRAMKDPAQNIKEVEILNLEIQQKTQDIIDLYMEQYSGQFLKF